MTSEIVREITDFQETYFPKLVELLSPLAKENAQLNVTRYYDTEKYVDIGFLDVCELKTCIKGYTHTIFNASIKRALHCCGFAQISPLFLHYSPIHFSNIIAWHNAANLFLDMVIEDSFGQSQYGGIIVSDVDEIYIPLHSATILNDRQEFKKIASTHNRIYSGGKPMKLSDNNVSRKISIWFMDCNEYLFQKPTI